MHVNFIMRSQSLSFFILLVFREAIFSLRRGTFRWVKFENAPGNGLEKYSLGRPGFSLEEDFVESVRQECLCNSISLESDPEKSWRKITNFLKRKGSRSYPTLKLGNKTAKTNPEKAQLFVESVEETLALRVICLANHNLIALISF